MSEQPASTDFLPGDTVRIIGPTEGGMTHYIGRKTVLTRGPEAGAMSADGVWFPFASLELLLPLALNTLVRVKESGVVSTITAIYLCEYRPNLFQLAVDPETLHYAAELLPLKRPVRPASGQIWSIQGQPYLLVQGRTLQLCRLHDTPTLIEGKESTSLFEHLNSNRAVFLADSLDAYARP